MKVDEWMGEAEWMGRMCGGVGMWSVGRRGGGMARKS